jgi:hypothetical protein
VLPVRVRLSAPLRILQNGIASACRADVWSSSLHVRSSVVGKVMASGNPVYSKQVVDSGGYPQRGSE